MIFWTSSWNSYRTAYVFGAITLLDCAVMMNGQQQTGPALFKSYGTVQIPILEKFSICQRKMKTEISVEY